MDSKLALAVVIGVVVLVGIPLAGYVKQALRDPEPVHTAGAPVPEEETGAPAEADSAENASPESAPLEIVPVPQSFITPDTFQRIAPGMTYADCVALFGSEGKPAGRDRGGAEIRVWENPGVMKAKITFQNGIVVGKGFEDSTPQIRPIGVEQARRFEQRAGRPMAITVDEYQRVALGMTYEQCVEIIGQHGEKAEFGASAAGSSGPYGYSPTQWVVWRNGGTEAFMHFENGRLVEKMWYGPAE